MSRLGAAARRAGAAAQTSLAGRASTAQDVYSPGDGVALPVLVRQTRAFYTPEARDARVEGVVVLDAVVLSDGRVGDVAVTRSLDATRGLDAQAAAALKEWQFRPGTKDGRPVAIRISVDVRFTLEFGFAPEQEVFSLADGVTPPVVVKQVRATYTRAAQAAGVQGEVVLDAVVRRDGTVANIEVVRSLDATTGLDEQAIKAMTQWEFKPGTKDGTPVPVRVSAQMRFSLR